jgi:PHP family Zn ribbon phosphoesterase
VERDYRSYLANFGTEFDILMRASREDLLKKLPAKVVEGVMRMRVGRVSIKPGYDGEYGIISIFDKDTPGDKNEEQLKLF